MLNFCKQAKIISLTTCEIEVYVKILTDSVPQTKNVKTPKSVLNRQQDKTILNPNYS